MFQLHFIKQCQWNIHAIDMDWDIGCNKYKRSVVFFSLIYQHALTPFSEILVTSHLTPITVITSGCVALHRVRKKQMQSSQLSNQMIWIISIHSCISHGYVYISSTWHLFTNTSQGHGYSVWPKYNLLPACCQITCDHFVSYMTLQQRTVLLQMLPLKVKQYIKNIIINC